jgi:hypothetical protein
LRWVHGKADVGGLGQSARPVVAEALAVKVNMLVLLVLAGLNDAVTPFGRLEITDRDTLPVKPLIGFTVIVLVPLLP